MKTLNRLLGLALVLACQSSLADDADVPSMFHLSGFGTAGVVHSDNPNADFISTVSHPNGAGHTSAWSDAVDSKLGVQLNVTPSDRLTAIVQLISQQKADNNWAPSVEWANLSYKLTPDWSVRAGRTVWPLFLRSESINVGFANYGVRGSAELAAEMPNTHSDGLDTTYHFKAGPTNNALTAMVGASRIDYDGSSWMEVTQIHGLSHVLEYDALTLHAALMTMTYYFVYHGGVAANIPIKMLTLGAAYDDGGPFAVGDIMRALDPYYGRMDAWAVTGGWHLGDWSPYLGISSFTQSTYGPGSSPLQTPTNQTFTAGVRWDFRTNFDLKVQYDRVQTGDVATVFPINYIFQQGVVPAGFLAAPNSNVLSAVVDFIF